MSMKLKKDRTINSIGFLRGSGIPMLFLFFTIQCKQQTGQDRIKHSLLEEVQIVNDSAPEVELSDVIHPVNEIVISGQQTVKPVFRKVGAAMVANGTIEVDPSRNKKVSARLSGRIEKLFVKFNYQYVKKGDKILELYSPEANTILEEYLHNVKNKLDKKLIIQSEEKLVLLGFLKSDIGKISKLGIIPQTVTVYSPYEGYIIFSPTSNTPAVGGPIASVNMNNDMQAMPGAGKSKESADIIKEGSYIEKDQTLFVINDFRQVWAVISIPQAEGLKIKINTPAKVISNLLPESFNAKVDFIEPAYTEEQKFIRARLYLSNQNYHLKINSLVKIEISGSTEMMVLPSSSVYDLGKRKITWVVKRLTRSGIKMFEARLIHTGTETENFILVLSGIALTDEVAKDAAYMVDSESLIYPK